MDLFVGIYVTVLSVVNFLFMLYIYYERFHAFKDEGQKYAEKVMYEHFQKVRLDEESIMEDFRNSVRQVIANTDLAGQQALQQLNEDLIKAHTDHAERFNQFSSKLYSVLVDSGNHFSQQLQQHITDSNKHIEEWQASYIDVMKHEIDTLLDNERQKLIAFTEEEKGRITTYIKEQALRDTSVIVEEVLGNSISIKDQEKMAQQAIEKFFR